MPVLDFLRRLFRSAARSRPGPAGPPSQPRRVACADLDAVPPVADLQRWAVVGQHVVLQFPAPCRPAKPQIIERLAARLPGHRVFDSGPGPDGTECVTVYKVLDEAVVLANRPRFLRALRDFSDTAQALCRRLAEAHGIAPEDLLARQADLERAGQNRIGEWTYVFHGLECCFTSVRTGQVVDVRLGFGDEFGVLDPYFLAHFLRTTPAHREVADLLADDYHNPSRVLEVLQARGDLREVAARDVPSRGLVLARQRQGG
jgi:hypothetical protein